ncbi:MAG TPA: deoxyguanosinetriphosphate triphosphohydrolase [Alphaproteobacteria bacterium]|nr:deoxyguanosinetriphosphate triphosphohydrolase [Alphaproteobacteria bacterium]
MISSVLAPYASDPAKTRGRLAPEPESSTRTPHQRDRDRIIHSAAFRRLKYKTQVFVYHEGDYYRTRLTHSLEVAQIARSISRALSLNEDLAEALALAHDLGHPPFGHAGEEALDEAMKPFGGFNHNAQTLGILTRLEQRYAEFDGLNLTWETLEGVVKHNGPLVGDNAKGPVPESIRAYNGIQDLELETWPSAEAQVAALSDDIAYNNHDIDDGLRAGLFTIEDLRDIPLVGPTFESVEAKYPGLERPRLIHESIRRLIDHMVNDLLAETRKRLVEARPRSADDVRRHGGPVVAFSSEMRQNDRALRTFLFTRMYRHFRVNRMTSKARRVVRELFTLFLAEPECLPTEWFRLARTAGSDETARVVTDYIAGMTDRYALDEHRRLYDVHDRP